MPRIRHLRHLSLGCNRGTHQRPPFVFPGGIKLSIQAGDTYHSTPYTPDESTAIGFYTKVEVAVLVNGKIVGIKDMPSWLKPWADEYGPDCPFGYLPVDKAAELYNLMIDMFGEPTLTYK